jgi:hypothetical protein
MVAKLSSCSTMSAASRATSVPPRAHRDADGGLLDRRRVVDPVAGHRHDLAAIGLQRLHDAELVLGVDPREHPHRRQHLAQAASSSLRNASPVSVRAPSSQSPSSARWPRAVIGWSPVIITTRMPALRAASMAGFTSGRGRVDHPHEAGEHHVLLEGLGGRGELVAALALGHGEHPQRPPREALGGGVDARAQGVVEGHHAVVGERVGAAGEQHVDRALGAQHHRAVSVAAEATGGHRHALALGVEGQAEELVVLLEHRVPRDLHLRREGEERGLGGVAGDLRAVAVVGEQRGVHHRADGTVLRARLGGLIDAAAVFEELAAAVVALAVTAYSWPTHQITRTVISLRVRVPVLSEQITVAQPRVSTAESLRTTAPRWAMRCIPSARVIDVIAGSPSGIAATATLTAVSSSTCHCDEAPREADDEERGADAHAQPEDHRAEIVEALFEGRALLLDVGEQLAHAADLGVAPGGHDHAPRVAVHRGGAREDHVGPVAHGALFGHDEVGALLHRGALARELALHGAQLRRGHQPQVGGHLVARLEHHEVARHELHGVDLHHGPAPAHLAARGGELEQRVEGLLGLALLVEPDERVDHHDGQDRERVAEPDHPVDAPGSLPQSATATATAAAASSVPTRGFKNCPRTCFSTDGRGGRGSALGP